MSLRYIDTNLIIRYITKDDQEKAFQCNQLFQELRKGNVIATTIESVIVEAVYVLSSKSLYNISRLEIQKQLSIIIRLKGLQIYNKRILLKALEIYVNFPRLDYVDALLIANMYAENSKFIYSFDQDFDKLHDHYSINRIEPQDNVE